MSGRDEPSPVGDQEQPRPRVQRYDAGQQREVVVDDRSSIGRRSRRRAQARLAQEQEQEEEALLDCLHRGAAESRRSGVTDGTTTIDSPASFRPIALPAGDQPVLQLLEAGAALVLAELAQARLVVGDEIHPGLRAASSARTL